VEILDRQGRQFVACICAVQQMSGARDDRPVLAELLAELEPGDTLIVWRLDRLGRSMDHLLSVVKGLGDRGINFESIHDRVDTSSATGKFMFHVLGALSEFERDLARERINAGLAAAKARGQRLGPPTVINPSKRRLIDSLLKDNVPKAEIARAVGISRATLYRHLDDREAASAQIPSRAREQTSHEGPGPPPAPRCGVASAADGAPLAVVDPSQRPSATCLASAADCDPPWVVPRSAAATTSPQRPKTLLLGTMAQRASTACQAGLAVDA
jgi:DNA invertase Pin-like site-specific DNA recombinase